MMNDLTGMEGRKLRMPSVSPLRVMGRVTGRQRGWALGINTIPFHFPATAFPVEMATPQPTNLSSTVRGDDNLRLSFEKGSYQGGYRLTMSREDCCAANAEFCSWRLRRWMSDHALCDTDSDSQFTVFYTMKVTEHLRLDLGLKYITLCLSVQSYLKM